jgi:hypothetical protein
LGSASAAKAVEIARAYVDAMAETASRVDEWAADGQLGLTTGHLDAVLEEVCRPLSHDGKHE